MQCLFIFGSAAKILKHGRGQTTFRQSTQIVYRQAGIKSAGRSIMHCVLEQSNRFRCKNPAQVLQASKFYPLSGRRLHFTKLVVAGQNSAHKIRHRLRRVRRRPQSEHSVAGFVARCRIEPCSEPPFRMRGTGGVSRQAKDLLQARTPRNRSILRRPAPAPWLYSVRIFKTLTLQAGGG